MTAAIPEVVFSCPDWHYIVHLFTRESAFKQLTMYQDKDWSNPIDPFTIFFSLQVSANSIPHA